MMKRMKYLLLALLLAFLPSVVSAEDFDPKAFHIEVDRILPMGFPSNYVDGFYMELKNDSVSMYMPYVGSLDMAPIGADSGLNFTDEPIYDYKTEKGKKDVTMVTFKVKPGIVEFCFRIKAFTNNVADIDLTRTDGQPCGYYGEWRGLTPKDQVTDP